MKKILSLMTTFLAILLLAGCVSIPMTDGGSIEISADGLTVIPADDKEEVAGIVENEEESTGEGGTSTNADEGTEGAVDEEGVEEENGSENSDTSDESTEFASGEGFGGCAHEFYLLKNRLPAGFPIPECAYVTSFGIVEDRMDNSRAIAAQYQNFGPLKDEHENIKSFFLGEGYTVKTDEVGTLSVEKNGIEITVTNEDVGSDSLLTGIQYIESPIIQYQVTDSFLNLTSKGHGKCSDEYYTSLSLLPENFPLVECAKTLFIEIENFDSASNHAAFYEVDGMWADHYNAFVAYAEANNFTISQNEGVATQGELNYTDGATNVNITVEKIDNTKANIHLFISKSH